MDHVLIEDELLDALLVVLGQLALAELNAVLLLQEVELYEKQRGETIRGTKKGIWGNSADISKGVKANASTKCRRQPNASPPHQSGREIR